MRKYNSEKKVVYCYETDEVFDSIGEAAKIKGVDRAQLKKAIDNPKRKAGQCHWYIDLEFFNKFVEDNGIVLTKGVHVTTKSKGNYRGNNNRCIYCYETKEKFDSITQAAITKSICMTTIRNCLDKPNRTAGNFHWCTDLAIFDGMNLSSCGAIIIYCYETKEKFSSISDAANKYNITIANISRVLNDPTRASGGYHWCTDLAIFDAANLSKGMDLTKRSIFCYETKEKFDSVMDAKNKYNLNTNMNDIIDNPNRTAGNFHWCTDLSVFDEADLSAGNDIFKMPVFCYETKEKFESLTEAAEYIGLSNASYISIVLNDPNKSAASYHWCTDLTIFDGVNLNSGHDIYKIPIYCYETKVLYDSIRDARLKTGINHIQNTINESNKIAGGYHWCTDLTIFDGVKLSGGNDLNKVPLYCYETKEKFESLTEVANKLGIINGSPIGQVLNNQYRTAYDCHWCTDLAIFDGVELSEPGSGTSIPEKEIADFIKSIYNKEIITNTRNIISPYELDIYLPELKLAFEFNGDYWHSEAKGKDKNYHINKTNLCKNLGIQLIHIFEYQWISKTNMIKSMIMNKLNKNQIRLYARNCEVKLIDDNNIIKQFLEENHIQGFVNSDINIGLYCNNILVSIMTFGKSRFDKSVEYELLRYACLRSTNVIGGASKLLKYFENNFKPKSLISYADISYSNGNLYTKLGFDYVSTSDPDYISIRNGIVYPRFKTMKHKLPKLLGEDNFDINLTEQQNLENNGFSRIWRCGNLKYLKEYENN